MPSAKEEQTELTNSRREPKTWLDNIKDWAGLKFKQLRRTAEDRKMETICGFDNHHIVPMALLAMEWIDMFNTVALVLSLCEICLAHNHVIKNLSVCF